MFKYIFSLLILTSCQTKINNPIQNISDNIQNMPQISNNIPKVKNPIENQIFKGNYWKIEVSPEWKQVAPGGAQLALFTIDETSMALLQKREFSGDLKSFADMIISSIRSTGANLAFIRKISVNTMDSIEIETIMEGGVAWSWIFIFDDEGYSLTCGGEISKFEKNRSLCLSLLNKLYIGKAP